MPKKDYQKRLLKNPFFKKKKNKKRKKIFLFVFLIIFLISFFIYLFFYSPLFIIKHIEIEGNKRTEDFLIKDLAWQIGQERRILDIRADNLWFFPKNRLKEEMYTRLDLANIRIKKSLFNKLIIDVSEREAAFILKNDNNYQFRDISACPINILEINDFDLNTYPIIKKDNLSETEFNSCLNLHDDYINDVLKLHSLVNNSYSFSIDKIIINSERFTLIIILDEGPRVYISRHEDFRKQIEKLNLTIVELERESQLSDINYIDVRYGDKAFINYK